MKEIILQLDDTVSIDYVVTLLAPYIKDVKINLTGLKTADKIGESIVNPVIQNALNTAAPIPAALGTAAQNTAVSDSLPIFPKEDISKIEEEAKPDDDAPREIPPLVETAPGEIIREVKTPAVSSSIIVQTMTENFLLVQGGTFTMGSDDGEDDEKPAHQITLSNFYVDKYEVTQKEWLSVMEKNPSYFKGDNLPVEQVSWDDAVEYCNKRSLVEGLVPAYKIAEGVTSCDFNASGYRLPTEAEWEFAAKGGISASLSEIGNVEDAAWYANNSGNTTHPVGTKKPNALGLYDMIGNVWEWCWDCYGAYSDSAETNPQGVPSGTKHIKRGGSWLSGNEYLRAEYRNSRSPSVRYSVLGFRLVRSGVGS